MLSNLHQEYIKTCLHIPEALGSIPDSYPGFFLRCIKDRDRSLWWAWPFMGPPTTEQVSENTKWGLHYENFVSHCINDLYRQPNSNNRVFKAAF